MRLVLRLTAATADAPPTLRAAHNGLSLFGDEPVPLPGFACDAACALVLGARSGGAATTDHHWVDNLRMSGPPGRPAPPVLVNATATSLLLAWFVPHHGGEEVVLYRLRMWRRTRWLNLYLGARTNHTVHYLEQGTSHLFRLQAYNTNGWGASSPSASFATATWPLASHAAPPRVPRVNVGSCVCGGKLYIAGGQSVARAAVWAGLCSAPWRSTISPHARGCAAPRWRRAEIAPRARVRAQGCPQGCPRLPPSPS